MDSAKLNDWLQVIGLFGVIGSLIFVGLQMKQDREIALAGTYQDRTAAVAETLSSVSSNKEAMSALIKTQFGLNPGDPIPPGYFELDEGLEPLTAGEVVPALYYSSAMWFHWDNSHFQYQNGYLPESHWSRIRSIIKARLSQNSIARLGFELSPRTHRREFREEIENILAEIDAESEN
jgi:hypothetical protein